MDARDLLRVDHADRKVWIVKVPGFLSRAWEENEHVEREDDEELQGVKLGQVRIDRDGNGKAKFTFELDEDVDDELPKKYDMRYTEDDLDLVLLSEGPHGEASVEGRVQQKFDLRPALDEDGNVDELYRALARKRFRGKDRKLRTVQVLDQVPSRVETVRVLPTAGTELRRKGLERGAYLSDLKRTRMEKADLESLLFRLFERQTAWSFNQLQNESKQPSVWLREVLQEVAVLNKKGANQNLWELKPEYKHGDS